MGKLVILVLVAALTCGTVYLYLKHAATAGRQAANGDELTPLKTVDQAQRTAKEIERSTQLRIDNLAKKTERAQ